MQDLVAAGEPAAEHPAASAKDDLVSALVHLGYSRPEAERGVDRALQQDADGRFEDLLAPGPARPLGALELSPP